MQIPLEQSYADVSIPVRHLVSQLILTAAELALQLCHMLVGECLAIE